MTDIAQFVQKPEKLQKQEMEEFKLEKLREKHRKEQITYREKQREFLLEKARFLQVESKQENLNDYDITILAKILKNKSQVSCELLIAVMNSLLDSKENIPAFLKVDGALQALLRLLSGQNEKYQLLSAQCICNLALGNEKQSLQVLKASESYLMVHLSGRNYYIMEACTIALGNFSKESPKNIELLLSQGFFSKIINLINSSHLNLEAAAAYALSQVIYYGFNIISPTDIESCLLAILPLFKKRSFSLAFLMSLFSSSKSTHNHLISNGILSNAIEYLLISLKEKENEALYFLRIVSNLICEESGNTGKVLIQNHSYTMRECVTCLLKSEKGYLVKECLGLIGNLLNHPVEELKVYGTEVVKENFELIKLYMRTSNSSFDKMVLQQNQI